MHFASFPVLLTTLVLLLTLRVIFRRLTRNNSNTKAPPSCPWKLPIFGNLHQLLGRPAHLALRDLSSCYGTDVLHLRLGQVDHIVVSSIEAAKEVLQTHDVNFSNRPRLIAAEILAYNCTNIAFSPYGAYWRQLRKVCILKLLSARHVKDSWHVRQEEVSKVVRYISAQTGTVNVTKMLMALSGATMVKLVTGSQCAQEGKLISEMKKAVAFANGLNLLDVFPTFRIVDLISGASSYVKKIHRELDGILDVIIEEHRNKKAHRGDDDLVDVLLHTQEKGGLDFPLPTDSIKAIIFDMFFAGTETTETATVWAMTELVRHPWMMEKARAEVRRVLKGNTRIEDTDMEELHYMKLVIKEAFRLHPPIPLLLPRVGREPCRVMGYEIPVDSRVLINVWALGRDPRYWEEPESFKPERFEGSKVDFRGANLEFLPFGRGRRMCPGLALGLANVELALANLLYYFDWELPQGMKADEVDMEETIGGTAAKKKDLLLIAKPHNLWCFMNLVNTCCNPSTFL